MSEELNNLGKFWNKVMVDTKVDHDREDYSFHADENVVMCEELATDILVAAGLEENSLDTRGVSINEDVQALLTLAMHLSPALYAHLATLHGV